MPILNAETQNEQYDSPGAIAQIPHRSLTCLAFCGWVGPAASTTPRGNRSRAGDFPHMLARGAEPSEHQARRVAPRSDGSRPSSRRRPDRRFHRTESYYPVDRSCVSRCRWSPACGEGSLLVESRRFPPFDDRPVADMEMCIQGRKTRKSLKTDRLTSSVRSCSG